MLNDQIDWGPEINIFEFKQQKVPSRLSTTLFSLRVVGGEKLQGIASCCEDEFIFFLDTIFHADTILYNEHILNTLMNNEQIFKALAV